jgi:hypothetical protein
MQEAAQMLFKMELGPALQALLYPLERVKEIFLENSRPWDTWLTHTATATVSTACMWLVLGGLWRP